MDGVGRYDMASLRLSSNPLKLGSAIFLVNPVNFFDPLRFVLFSCQKSRSLIWFVLSMDMKKSALIDIGAHETSQLARTHAVFPSAL